MSNYIFKYNNKEITATSFENDYEFKKAIENANPKKPVIIYIYDNDNEVVLKSNQNFNCFGDFLGPNYSKIGVNIPKNNKNNDETEFENKIKNVLNYIRRNYKFLRLLSSYDKEDHPLYKTMNCSFIKDKNETDYKIFKVEKEEYELISYNIWFNMIKKKVNHVRPYFQLILKIVGDNQAQLTYNIRQLTYVKSIPKPLI